MRESSIPVPTERDRKGTCGLVSRAPIRLDPICFISPGRSRKEISKTQAHSLPELPSFGLVDVSESPWTRIGQSRWDECMLNKGERLAKRERARSQSQLREAEGVLGTGVKGTDNARPNLSYFSWSSLGKKSQRVKPTCGKRWQFPRACPDGKPCAKKVWGSKAGWSSKQRRLQVLQDCNFGLPKPYSGRYPKPARAFPAHANAYSEQQKHVAQFQPLYGQKNLPFPFLNLVAVPCPPRTSPRSGTRASPGAPGPCHISTGEPGPDRYRNTSPGASSGLKRLC